MDDNQKQFIEDILDLLNQLDEGLMQLEATPQASAPLEQVFRIMHTVKGAANMFGFEHIGELAHHLETLFDLVRDGHMQVSDDLVSITLNAFDKVRDLLQKKNLSKIEDPKELKNHLDKVKLFLERNEIAGNAIDSVSRLSAQTTFVTYLVEVYPNIKITADGNHPILYIVKDIEALGMSKVAVEVKKGKTIDHWNMILATVSTKEEIESYFLFVEQECKVIISPLAAGNLLETPAYAAKINNFLDRKITKKQLNSFFEHINNQAQKPDMSDSKDEPTPIGYQQAIIKVKKHKIDDLLNKISELVILKSQLLNVAHQTHNIALNDVAEQIESVVGQLLGVSLDISLIQIETLVTLFKRLVRDLSRSLGKKVNFISQGVDTEMDKDIIETMTQPLLHIIRNAVDHGIEPPDERKSQGKSEHGTIKLHAFRSSAFINLVISDDGKGIDKDKIINKAIKYGLINGKAQLTDDEAFNLIFHPGLTTANTISDISGRGVGMDVVKQKISELRGSIKISSSTGSGTQFYIKLPLSRSIIDGLLVKVADTQYIIPINVIERIDRIPTSLLNRKNKIQTEVMINEKPVPVLSLREQYHSEKGGPKTSDVISINVNSVIKGIAVDMIEGMMQVILKPMGDMYNDQDFISGSAILGDGAVALVLDPDRLFSRHIKKDSI
ncbi:chemotaxis protein CheA [Fulvivirga sp. 29W222]|uniref:Chemotaxis protein CheA n=1 Tax=Fulvivirga marina TaxID=2494733 RepID=A0A937KE29_9BACT|nr:chemotaxis protein CheA [Fulvivirga marina]MBL6449282.1 chemotaxis protein CheA [Fulvivirga marina]